MKKFSLIVATDSEWGIGKNGELPWHLPNELKHFSEVTSQGSTPENPNVVIMGRVTWDSIPPERRPLKNRKNIVLSRNPDYSVPKDVGIYESLDEALKSCEHNSNIFVIGGARVYHEAIQRKECEKIYLTQIEGDYKCDAFFPKIYEDEFELIEESPSITENDIDYKYLIYTKRIA